MLDKFNNKKYVLEKLSPPPGAKIYERIIESRKLKREIQENLVHKGKSKLINIIHILKHFYRN